MTHSRGRILVASLIGVLAGAASLLVGSDGLSTGQGDRRGEEFQRLVGGLGMGPAVDLSRCAFSFDPRICPDCPLNHEPVPGGCYFCSQHACSILYYPPLRPGEENRRKGEGDGRSP